MALAFHEWVSFNGKAYATDVEYSYRKTIFETNVHTIMQHNSGNHSWTMGMNKFTDLTADEFASQFAHKYTVREQVPYTRKNLRVPEGIDWRTYGAVTPVKNQFSYDGGWAFAATGAIEGAWAISNGTLLSLSEQQLIDCSPAESNQGYIDSAFQYVIDAKGITTETTYPYTGAGPGNCTMIGIPTAATLTKYAHVPSNSEDALLAAVAQQPIAVAIDAGNPAFQFYSSGIITGDCGSDLDHTVLIIGYGSEEWVVKNSWGVDWGDNGYVRISRGNTYGPTGQCGILAAPSYPIV
jgi:KDEL-tailed cysteine endopeptidase